MVTRESLLAEIGQGVLNALKQHRSGDIPPLILRDMAANSEKDEATRCFLAMYPETPSRILEELYEEAYSVDVLKALANNPRTPKTQLQGLAKSEQREVRMAVARSRYLSPQAASILCDDSSPFVRAALAGNSALTPRVQAQLSNDEVAFVRTSLLHSPRLDEEMYTALADDQDMTVQAACLLSPRVPEDTLLQWADKEEHFAQSVLMKRKNLPPQVLQSLCFSSYLDIQQAAMSQRELPPDEMLGFATSGEEAVRVKIASSPMLPQVVQQVLAQDKSRQVLKALAASPAITAETVEALIGLEDEELTLELSRNDSVPVEALEKLAGDGNLQVLKNLAGRPCPQSILDAIYATDSDEVLYQMAYNGLPPTGMPMPLLLRLLDSPLPTLRSLAVSSEQLPLQRMAGICQDPSYVVRKSLARNPQVPRVILETLSEDEDPRVRNLAISRLKH